ncbi:MAG: hypothetical protein ACE5OS_13845 [Anaerolineae bacterium]
MDASLQAKTTIEAKLKELARSGPLPVAQALDWAHAIADLVEQAAAPLEEGGYFEQAADLYEKAARAFRLAMEKVPRKERKRLASLEDFWSVKADVTRRAAPPTPPVEQPKAPTTGSLLPKVQPAAEPKPSAAAFERPGEVPGGRRPVIQPPSLAGRPRPSAVAQKKPGEIPGGHRLVAQPPSLAGVPKPSAIALRKLGEMQGVRWPVAQSPPFTGEPKASAISFRKLGEVQAERRPVAQSPPLIDKSKPSAIAKLRQALGLKKPDKA